MKKLGYLKGVVFKPYKISFYGMILQLISWLHMSTWFGTFSAPGVRIRAGGLVYPLSVAQTMWFGMPNFCSTKEEWVEHGIEDHEVDDSNNV